MWQLLLPFSLTDTFFHCKVDVFITAPSLALRDVTSCTAAPGSALLAVEAQSHTFLRLSAAANSCSPSWLID